MRRVVAQKGSHRKSLSVKKAPRNTRKPNLRFLTSLFLFSTVLSCAASFVLQTPSLTVKKIKISGLKYSDKAYVTAVAEYAREKNIILLQKGPAINKISSLTEVADVRMGRTLPNKIWIRVFEREPYACITDGRGHYLMDSDGFVFHKVKAPVKDIPVVVLDSSNKLKLAETHPQDDLLSGLKVLKCARQNKLAVTKISIDRAGNICLNMDSKFYVKLGQPDELEYKISQVSQAIVGRPSLLDDAEYIDASCPRAIVCRPKISAQAL